MIFGMILIDGTPGIHWRRFRKDLMRNAEVDDFSLLNGIPNPSRIESHKIRAVVLATG